MKLSDLRAAKEFALQYGCKSVIYGPPGSAKTPLMNTAPRPVLLACEPGMLSMRTSTIPTWQAHDDKRLDEFFTWFFHSNETKNFDTLCIDSISELAEIYLRAAQKANKHGLAAYGEMARRTNEQLNGVYYTMYKHTYLIAKQKIQETNGIGSAIPYFPGQELPVSVPHKYDFIIRCGKANVPGAGNVLAFQCNQSIDVMARNRTGNLADFEPPDFTALTRKALG